MRTVAEPESVQNVRLADVFVIGPLLLYAASRRSVPQWLSVALAVTGTATILYNGARWQEIERALTRK